MYPEVEAYVTACETANQSRDEAYEAARVAVHANEINHAEFDERQTTARRAARATCVDAWNALKASADPLVAFIAGHYQARYREATIVLKGLPADHAGLLKIAKDAGWCDAFDEYLDEMVDAGVVTNVPPQPSKARRALVKWFKNEHDGSSYEVGRLNELVDAVVTEAIAPVEA